MAVNQARAKKLWKQALHHLIETDPKTLARFRKVGPATFRNLRLKAFLSEYCWVVYASGFRFAVIKSKFPSIKTAFKDFDPAALSRMRSVHAVLKVFDNEQKATCFLLGAHAVIEEGFNSFKSRLRKDGVKALQDLPGIGPITKNHLAKDIGLADVAKADIHLVEAARRCEASFVAELTAHLSDLIGKSQRVVDLAIWTCGKDRLLYSF